MEVAREGGKAMSQDRLLTELEVEKHYGITVHRLRNMRNKPGMKDPMPFIKIGRSVFYRVKDIDKYLERQTR